MEKIIAQGAEAILTKKGNLVLKDRMQKSYRIKEIDEKLRKQRTRREASLLEKAGKIINTPKIIKQNQFSLEIEFIRGDKLSKTLSSYLEKKQFEVMQILGEEVGKLHDADIIHGDLTTSNTILVENNYKKDKSNKTSSLNAKEYNSLITEGRRQSTIKKNEVLSSAEQSEADKVFIIDFGLGFISKRIEDKSVDLHLIKQALEAKHFQNHQLLFNHFLEGYNPKEKDKILEQLKKVEARGRYKH